MSAGNIMVMPLIKAPNASIALVSRKIFLWAEKWYDSYRSQWCMHYHKISTKTMDTMLNTTITINILQSKSLWLYIKHTHTTY